MPNPDYIPKFVLYLMVSKAKEERLLLHPFLSVHVTLKLYSIYSQVCTLLHIMVFQQKEERLLHPFLSVHVTQKLYSIYPRVGHRILLRSERIILLRSFKARNVLIHSFFEFLATYETQKNDAFFCILFLRT